MSVSGVRKDTSGLLLVAISLVVLLLAFTPTLISFPPAWLNRGGQGFAAAAFALYLIWRDREKLSDFRSAIPEVSLVVAGLSLLWLVAFVLNVQVVHQASLPLVVLAWLLAVGGVRPAVVALPIVAVFFLAVPVWGLLTGILQAMTILANGVLLKVAGIEAVIRGETIEIAAGVFWVAQGCAGINYFETSLLISAIYALSFLKNWKYRFVAVGVAVALSLVSNWLRVFGLIVIGHVTKMQSSLIAEHEFYGWVIFAVAMMIFFAITNRIEKRDRRLTDSIVSATSADETGARSLRDNQSSREVVERSSPTRTQQLSPVRLAVPTFAAVLGPLLFLVLGGRGASGVEPAAAPGVNTDRTSEIRPVLLTTSDGLLASERLESPSADATEDSTGVVISEATRNAARVPPQWRPRYGGADKHQIAQFAFADDTVRQDRLIYTMQGQGKELISGLNVIAAQEHRMAQQTIGPLDATGRMVNTTVVRTQDGARLVWHWFSVGGSVTHSATRAKLLELLAFVRTNSPPAELITVSALCAPDDCSAANSTLYEFVLGRKPN